MTFFCKFIRLNNVVTLSKAFKKKEIKKGQKKERLLQRCNLLMNIKKVNILLKMYPKVL